MEVQPRAEHFREKHSVLRSVPATHEKRVAEVTKLATITADEFTWLKFRGQAKAVRIPEKYKKAGGKRLSPRKVDLSTAAVETISA